MVRVLLRFRRLAKGQQINGSFAPEELRCMCGQIDRGIRAVLLVAVRNARCFSQLFFGSPFATGGMSPGPQAGASEFGRGRRVAAAAKEGIRAVLVVAARMMRAAFLNVPSPSPRVAACHPRTGRLRRLPR